MGSGRPSAAVLTCTPTPPCMGAVNASMLGSFALFFLREWALQTTRARGVSVDCGGDGSALCALVDRGGVDRSSADEGVPKERSESSSALLHTVMGAAARKGK